LDVRKVVVLPFQRATQGDDEAMSAPCPLCGAMFRKGEIEAGAEAYLTGELMEWLKENTAYSLVPSGTAQGARSKLLSEDPGVGELTLLLGIGKALHADGVVSGTIYRFEKRIGAAFSVERPASVAFGVHFVNVPEGRVSWVGHFDETQPSLSENVLRLPTFVKRGGRWLTAEQLASFGLRKMMAGYFLESEELP
jgi:hypothetical protein